MKFSKRIVIFTFFVLLLLWLVRQYISIDEMFDECSVLETIRLSDGVVLEIVDEKCKEGLPHTSSSSTIRMTRDVYKSPRRDEILRHEQVHLAQKRDLATWYTFYKSQWDYECLKYPPAHIPAALRSALRRNPDTADAPWALWRKKWLFFPVSNREGALRDSRVVVWNIETQKEVDVPEEWKTQFCDASGCIHQYEHPHEIAAEIWTSMKSRSPAAVKLFKFHQ